MSRPECDQALEWIDAAVDAELPPPDAAWLESHLAACPPCQAHHNLAQAVKQSVQRSCCPTPTPEPVRQRIVAQIAMSSQSYRAQFVVRRTIRVEIHEIED